jgi:hypothetical protein
MLYASVQSGELLDFQSDSGLEIFNFRYATGAILRFRRSCPWILA